MCTLYRTHLISCFTFHFLPLCASPLSLCVYLGLLSLQTTVLHNTTDIFDALLVQNLLLMVYVLLLFECFELEFWLYLPIVRLFLIFHGQTP